MSENVKKIEHVAATYGRGKMTVLERKGTRLVRRVEDIVSISEEARERLASEGKEEACSKAEESSDREVALYEDGDSEKLDSGGDGRDGKARMSA